MNTASMMTTSNALPRVPCAGRCPTGAAAPLVGLEPALGISLMPWLEHPCADMAQMIAALLDGVALLRWFYDYETPRHPCEFPLNAGEASARRLAPRDQRDRSDRHGRPR